MQYELFYLVGASKEADLETIKREMAEIVTSEGGVFEEKQVTEKRKLAYKIGKETYGFYVAQRFNLEELEKIEAINKKMNLYNKILRFMVSRTEDLPELTSREEREKIKNKVSEIKSVAKKEREAKEEIKETKEDKKTEAASAEDIDEKLEEILNI